MNSKTSTAIFGGIMTAVILVGVSARLYCPDLTVKEIMTAVGGGPSEPPDPVIEKMDQERKRRVGQY